MGKRKLHEPELLWYVKIIMSHNDRFDWCNRQQCESLVWMICMVTFIQRARWFLWLWTSRMKMVRQIEITFCFHHGYNHLRFSSLFSKTWCNHFHNLCVEVWVRLAILLTTNTVPRSQGWQKIIPPKKVQINKLIYQVFCRNKKKWSQQKS